jgi:protocatechuate 3,4-dioxygenase beta subunit
MPPQHQASENIINRRAFLKQSLLLPGALLILSCASPASNTASAVHTTPSPQAATTPQATITDIQITCIPTPTPSQTEGPFYKSGSPERTSLREPGLAGTPLTVSGYVLSTTCQPIAHAWLDFWQADSNGNYDNTGFRLRGHQYTGNYGQYTLKTILPGEYPGRTRHIHVKVQAPGQSILTTQLYFPGEPRNDSDGIFSPDLLMLVKNTPNGLQATFNFVLAFH